jgi:hypothetical protein
MARNWVEVRKLDETKPAFDKLKKFMLAIHGKAVKLNWYTDQRENPWSVAERGYTSPLCYQASTSHHDKEHYPSSKRVMANMLLKHFLPSVGYTLKRIVEVRPQAFWIEVKELKTIAFHVFTFRGGGIGVSVGPILGDMGMKADIKDSGVLDASKRKKDALIASARSKLTSEEREALGL